MYIPTFILIIGLSLVCGQDRKIISQLNPGCSDCGNDNVLVVYLQEIGTKDVIHQLWDFTGVPSVLYAIGKPNSTITVGWYNKKPTIFTFDRHPTYSFAVSIDKIYQYNDLPDKGPYDPSYERRELSLDRVHWTFANLTITDAEASLVMQGRLHRNAGFIDIKLYVIPSKGESTELPHLMHTANTSLIDVRLVNITAPRVFNSTRLALSMTLASTDPADQAWNCTVTKTLDDEHTPGVFEMISIRSPLETLSGDGGVLQFAPVAYTKRQRDVSSSTNAYIAPLQRGSLPGSGILRTFYQAYNSSLAVQQAVVSFGLAGDGFYTQHNFTSWSFTFGYGVPPSEQLSLLVFIVIVIFATALCGLLLGGVALLAYHLRRWYKQRAQFGYNTEQN